MAGLEGAGHHGLQAMLQGTGLVYNKAGLGAEATQGMFHHSLPDFKGVRDDLRSNKHIHIQREHLKTHLHNLIGNATQTGSSGNIFPLNPSHYGSYSMLSYPNLGSLIAQCSKSLQHPDIVTLARLCEEAGVDLRIIVMSRDPVRAVASTVRRGFGKAIAQTEALADNAAVLATQLQLMDNAFVMCMRSEMMGDAELWSKPYTWGHKSHGASHFRLRFGTNAQWLHPQIGQDQISNMVKGWHPPASLKLQPKESYENVRQFNLAVQAANISPEDAHVRTLAAATAVLETVAGCPAYDGAVGYK